MMEIFVHIVFYIFVILGVIVSIPLTIFFILFLIDGSKEIIDRWKK